MIIGTSNKIRLPLGRGADMLPSDSMNSNDILRYALWISPAALQFVIAMKMYRAKLMREFPCFFAYTVVHVLRFCILFSTYKLTRPPHAYYFFEYWAAEALDVVLGVAVVYEIYLHAFRGYAALRRLSNVVFQWALAMLLLAAVLVAAVTNGTEGNRVIAGILVGEQCFEFVRAGLLLLLFALSRAFGLTWRDYLFGIALGFGFYASVDLTVAAMRGQMGSVANAAYAVVKTGAYTCSVGIWAVYFLRSGRVTMHSSALPKRELESWNTALLQMLNR